MIKLLRSCSLAAALLCLLSRCTPDDEFANFPMAHAGKYLGTLFGEMQEITWTIGVDTIYFDEVQLLRTKEHLYLSNHFDEPCTFSSWDEATSVLSFDYDDFENSGTRTLLTFFVDQDSFAFRRSVGFSSYGFTWLMNGTID
ncbi:MAG: hypothetical protein KDC44_12020 [Phaeodactylibacter sp.]|nr:hypothetical protein [Phaeodactylibacter sp.]